MNRLIGNRIALKRYRSNLKIDETTHLNTAFTVEFMVTPAPRNYVVCGGRGLLNARIVFESAAGSVEIGERVYLGGCTIICRDSVKIGSDVTMAWGVTIYDHNSHSLDWRQRAKVVEHFYKYKDSGNCYEDLDWTGVASAPIVIDDKVWIGFDVTILKGVRIGEGAVIGAKSVVTRDVEPYTVVAGNPAVYVKRIDNQL